MAGLSLVDLIKAIASGEIGARLLGWNMNELGRVAHRELHSADTLAQRQRRTRGQHAARLDHRIIQDDAAHADKGAVFQVAGMDDGGVAHRHIGTDEGGLAARIHMDDGAVLDIGARPGADDVGVAAQDAVIPDIGALGDFDIADHGGRWRHPGVGVNQRRLALEGI